MTRKTWRAVRAELAVPQPRPDVRQRLKDAWEALFPHKTIRTLALPAFDEVAAQCVFLEGVDPAVETKAVSVARAATDSSDETDGTNESNSMPIEAVIKLGTQANAERLFSYPNLGHETDSLQTTIEHYISNSLTREGLSSSIASAEISTAECAVRISGLSQDESTIIQERYQAFFDVGQTGLRDIDAFAAAGKLDKAWQFLLPLGVPIAYARAVEVMDFPPLTLIQNQDYLKSKTTGRWWELLALNAVARNSPTSTIIASGRAARHHLI